MQPLTSIKLERHRKRRAASKLRAIHATRMNSPQPSTPLRIICISDTHNTHPILPPGDILIHAGDLTEHGSFDEVQAELKWLSNQPHKYKILIAGNHDVLFDETFLTKYPERRYGHSKTKEDLDWGNVIYLQDSSIILNFPSTQPALDFTHATAGFQPRRLTIFGSPWTSQYGISAFQYRPDDGYHWSTRFSRLEVKPDIVVTHGPPKHHLDARDFHRAGCPYLAEEISRLQPRLVVFGHIHASYGRERVFLDGVQRAYEEIMTGWAGWTAVGWMAILVLWAKLKGTILPSSLSKEMTIFVNAAVVGGPKNILINDPIVVEL
ncbi:Metallo-dependent phosphatase-like protein [Mariannaea sp. PMI_226]|nr:Metallo-dependent phosphatase-like protein [Mariannaea sp. PMI_226]